MCNDYERQVAWADYCKTMQALELGMPTDQTEQDLPQTDDTNINDMAPVMRAAGNGIELVQMNFSFPPSEPRGGPVFDFRSEGRRFDKSNRCLIPASAFFEFTGKKYPKAKHRFTPNDAPFLAIAGIWRRARTALRPPSRCSRRTRVRMSRRITTGRSSSCGPRTGCFSPDKFGVSPK